MRYLLTLAFLSFVTIAIAQETLNLEANSECELFSEKKEFDRNERLQEIKDLGGQFVTVYLVKGKSNKIKSTYTGKVDLILIERGESPLKNMTSVLIVTEDKGNGQMLSHLPLTDDKAYRIYLTECTNK